MEKTKVQMPSLGDWKDTLGEGVKGGVVGALGIGIGQALLGNLGQFLGACLAGAALKGTAGVVVTTYGSIDAILDFVKGEEERGEPLRLI